ncbi:cytochrome c oxidase assembly protein COX20, mitochondrial [Mobula hypostoma]|uniref:cytochrome c oxidase assembly protein COX20, mitochondrial n=1 Tax=Mobula hypostoma TaxID=723540 RepID=UPI002FC33150
MRSATYRPFRSWRQSAGVRCYHAVADGSRSLDHRHRAPNKVAREVCISDRGARTGNDAMSSEGEAEKPKSFKLLGILDVQNIPCARDSVLYGSAGAVIAGFGHFLATSRIKRSFDFGVGSFLVTTLGTWVFCRYQNAKLRIQNRMVQEGVKNKVIYEGTQVGPTRKADGSSGDN